MMLTLDSGKRPLLPLLTTLSALVAGPILAQEAPPIRPVMVEVVQAESPLVTGPDPTIGAIERFDQLPETFWAHGTLGDFILSNGFATAVFGQSETSANTTVATRRGNLIDFFTTPAVEENFQLLIPIIDPQRGPTIIIDSLEPVEDLENHRVQLVATGRDAHIENLSVDTTYTMRRGWPGLKVTTSLTNDSDETITIPLLGDYIAWGGMPVFIPGFGIAQRPVMEHPAEFIFAQLFDSVIMVAPTDGMMEVTSAGFATTLAYRQNVELAPGAAVEYSRWILTRQHDPGALLTFVLEQRGLGNFGYLVGKIIQRERQPDGRIVEAGDVADADVRIDVIRRPELPRQYIDRPYIITRTDASGRFQVALPPGEYLVKNAHFAHFFEPNNMTSRIVPNGITALDHGISPPTKVLFEVVDSTTGQPMPAKLTFVPLRGGGGGSTNLGPPGGVEAFNVVYSHTGRGTVSVAPGTYRVIASHGNEFHSQEQRLQIDFLQTQNMRFELNRAFSTEGFISADLGVLTDASPQSRTDREARVISAVAEGLNWIITADPGNPTDLTPTIARLGLQERIRATPGFRLTSDIHRPVGDYLVFPFNLTGDELTEFRARAEAATDARSAQAALRQAGDDAVIIGNRLLQPEFGLLTLAGFDFATGNFSTPDIAMNVDAIQVWEGKGVTTAQLVRPIHTLLLTKGLRPTAIGSSLSRGTFNREPGFPRVYIPSERSRPLDLDPVALADQIRRGNVQITNGPFIRMTVNGQDAGEIIRMEEPTLRIELEVFTPNWANVSAVNVLYNEVIVRRFVLPPGAYDANSGQAYPPPGASRTFSVLPPLEDGVLRVVVEGDPSLTQDPINPNFIPNPPPGVPPAGQTTLAISQAFLIDRNNDGELMIPFSLQLLAPEQGEIVPDF